MVGKYHIGNPIFGITNLIQFVCFDRNCVHICIPYEYKQTENINIRNHFLSPRRFSIYMNQNVKTPNHIGIVTNVYNVLTIIVKIKTFTTEKENRNFYRRFSPLTTATLNRPIKN